jgi:hypothetical protein
LTRKDSRVTATLTNADPATKTDHAAGTREQAVGRALAVLLGLLTIFGPISMDLYLPVVPALTVEPRHTPGRPWRRRHRRPARTRHHRLRRARGHWLHHDHNQARATGTPRNLPCSPPRDAAVACASA